MRKTDKDYVNDDRLVYEIILSQGKGFLTDKAKDMLISIVNNFMVKFHYYLDESYRKDCSQYAIYKLLTQWENFNNKKYYKALPYFTELAKRAIAYQFDELQNIKKGIKLETLSIEKWLEKNKI